jgi:cysteine-rich repeat protein
VRCGNGITDTAAGEICDEVPQDVSKCSLDCKSSLDCGNAILDLGEECDFGMSVNSETGECRRDCIFNRCGDGYTNMVGSVGHPEHIEQCDAADPAPENNRELHPTESATCNIDCSTAICGDGRVNPKNKTSPATSIGEQCDDGNSVDGDGCDTNCTVTSCGNGIPNPGEQCDDGNSANGDDCDNNCKLTGCGSGIVTGSEECDDGNQDSNDGCSTVCVTEFCGDEIKNNVTEECDTGTISSTCNGDCTVAECGDGKINQLFKPGGAPGPEQCDDGNILGNDGCSSACQFEFCGDGTKNNGTEMCDTAGDSQTCNADCTPSVCGDGKLNPSFTAPGAAGTEQCDDGNNAGDDGCSSTCRFERCGNNIVDPGEQCDGSRIGGVECFQCHLVTCGDGILDPTFGEQCDDGNNSENDDCVSNAQNPTTCKIATCGDGVRNTNREECDHGTLNGTAGDTCSATCHTVTCGNGIIEQGETCDDGPPASNNGLNKSCNASCHRNTCGDGEVLTGIEQCDSGGEDASACDADCTSPVCGDGHINGDAGEDCDEGALNGTSNAPDRCNAFCHKNGCGNDFVDFSEQCDPGTPATNTSTCDADCTFPVCGDGTTNALFIPAGALSPEVCDDGSSNGDVCAYGDQDCTRCNATCTGQVSPGGPFCGDATQNGPEVCDQGSLVNGSQCAYGDLTCLTPTASSICNSACDGFVPNPNGEFCGDGAVQTRFHEQCDPAGGLTPVGNSTCDNDCSFAICGDGQKNTTAGEQCDDGNTNTCGSCSADCQVPAPPTAAFGSITAIDGASITDGTTFTLNDGFHPSVVFEFDNNDVLTNINAFLISLSPGSGNPDNEPDQIAQKIRDVIIDANAPPSSLGITPTIESTAPTIVNLKNIRKSSLGNQPITSAVLPFAGMSGGIGGNCAANVGCATGDDCASGVCDAAIGRCQ